MVEIVPWWGVCQRSLSFQSFLYRESQVPKAGFILLDFSMVKL